MQKIVPVGLALVLVGSLSGCITVTCPPDDRPLYDSFGRVLKAYSYQEAEGMAAKNCPRDFDPPTETVEVPTDIEPSPPPAPTPTNLAPAIGGVVIAGAALGLGGNDNNQPVTPPPAPPVTSTTGTR